ncbi:MAG: DUF362 domain-containing protein [Deltaproteobacteria bacterium]|jgi:uncharacterized protein (DUF362 family)|nr:DUF362 domain-containing protein [Deltaproteobacteria bacterium]MDL1987173.1 DUF362 domain-containing protein [Deltaproteobacteria bacterium]
MNRVVIIKCPDYDGLYLTKNIERAFSYFGGIESLVNKGEKILLKPNLLVKDPARSGITTHPFVVKSVADIVRTAGGLPSVGDSPAFGSVHQVAAACGLLPLLKKDNIPVVSFRVNRSFNDKIRITDTVRDFDKIINIPKLKAHGQMLFSGAVKNLFGLVSGKVKAWRHFKARGSHEKFSLMVLAIYEQVRPCFTIVDAIDIMEKKGPRGGPVRRAGLLFAGINCISIDRVICDVFNINPDRVPLLKAARKYGINGCKLSDIQIEGNDVSDVRSKKYLFPEELNDISFSFPRVIKSVLRHFVTVHGGQ